MNLGEIRAALRACDPAAPVYVDNVPPTSLESYRGDYSQLAITTKRYRDDYTTKVSMTARADVYGTGASCVWIDHQDTTAGELVNALDLADGLGFEGYKGGTYTMRADTPVWCSEHGEWSRLLVSAIENLGNRVDLWTKEVDGW